MKESLLYGLPGGIVSGFLYFLLMDTEVPLIHEFRQLLVMMVVIGITIFETRKRNKAYFPFKFAWFSGFNTSFILSLSSSLLVLLFASDSMSNAEDADIRLVIGTGFLEFMNLLFFGLLLTTGYSFVFSKKRIKQ